MDLFLAVEAEASECDFEASLVYKVKTWLKQKGPGKVACSSKHFLIV